MKTVILALVAAGIATVASAQTVYCSSRSCGASGFGLSTAGRGFTFSYRTADPQVMNNHARSWGGYQYAPAVPLGYCRPQPVCVNPCAYPVRAPVYSYRPARPVVPNPVFPSRRAWR